MTIIFKDTLKTCIFILLFLSLIQPFGIDEIKEGRTRMFFIVSETVISFFGIIISTLLSNALMHNKVEDEKFAYQILHLLVFLFICTPLTTAMLLTYVSWFNTGNPLCYFISPNSSTIISDGLAYMSNAVFSISIITCCFVFYQARNKKLRKRLNEIENINRLLEKRQQQLADKAEQHTGTSDKHLSATTSNNNEDTPIKLHGQGKNSLINLIPSHIIYIESMANYADICYIANDKIHHSTLRITLKQLKSSLTPYNNLVQCHRAFLVNINFIVKMTTHNSSYQLQLFGMDKQIPVSRANVTSIKNEIES